MNFLRLADELSEALEKIKLDFVLTDMDLIRNKIHLRPDELRTNSGRASATEPVLNLKAYLLGGYKRVDQKRV